MKRSTTRKEIVRERIVEEITIENDDTVMPSASREGAAGDEGNGADAPDGDDGDGGDGDE